MTLEQRDIEGLEGLEIVVAVGAPRGLLPIEEVVVEREADRAQPVDLELRAQPLQEGGLPGRGRAGDEQHTQCAALPQDLVGDVGDALLVEGLGEADELQMATAGDQVVDVGDLLDVDPVQPELVLLVRLRETKRQDQWHALPRPMSPKSTMKP